MPVGRVPSPQDASGSGYLSKPIHALDAQAQVESPALQAPHLLQPPPLRSLPDTARPVSGPVTAPRERQTSRVNGLAGTPSGSEFADRPRRVRPGDEEIIKAANRIASHTSIKALLRQQVRMFDRTLVGNGAYHQTRRGDDVLLRMDLQLQLDDRAATFQQISDGRFLWKFQDSPDINQLGAFKQQLSRVDLEIVRRAERSSKNIKVNTAMGGLGFGGLPHLMNQFVSNFTFDVPLSGTLHEVPVLILNGSWYEPALRQILQQTRSAEDGEQPLPEEFSELLARLPAQFPHQVTIAIGKDDSFPYRIEYRRTIANAPSSGIVVKSNTRPIVTLELFQVQYDKLIDPSQFLRRAGDLPVRDVTEEFLRTHGLIYVPAGRTAGLAE